MASDFPSEEHANRITDAERAIAALTAAMISLKPLLVGIMITILVICLSVAVELFMAAFVVDLITPTVSGPANARLQLGANVMTVGLACGILFAHFIFEWVTGRLASVIDWLVFVIGLGAVMYFIFHGTGFSSQVITGSLLSEPGSNGGRTFGQSLGGLATLFDAIFPLAISITHLMARRIKKQFLEIVTQFTLRKRRYELRAKLDAYVEDYAAYQAKLLLNGANIDETLDVVSGEIAAGIADVAAAQSKYLRTPQSKLPAAIRDVPRPEREQIVAMLQRYSPQHVRDQLVAQGAL